eukprot:CAMPEP_0201499216 /NCGR_PEP_ID=MMETSP0151_2-20130828/75009_1 /ASSEMBLY_ACC=CAM_ASM_000257 /TAXON_ID=200890 /ORGANISM="Paramoeba atlantica, Strain 621/1 / CCAP 1560/9" /LENGTH=126 /DNA_ID=CAMNT_0047891369 /DNA_START=65 /DNA_END=445 /DNA_ORIENTATION=-
MYARNGNLKKLKKEIEGGALVDAFGIQRMTPLCYAAREQHDNCVEYLLSVGAKVNHQDDCGWTAILLAARERNVRSIELLLDAGADPQLKNKYGDTALSLSRDERITQTLKDYTGGAMIKPAKREK